MGELRSRMSRILLMPGVGDMVIDGRGKHFVMTSSSYGESGLTVEFVAASNVSRTPLRDELTQLGVATDDQLRAECERRFPRGFGVVHEVTLRECDEWKRIANHYQAEAERLSALLAAAPGIAAKTVTSRDGEDWPDPLDLLADDAR
jgi:hypothetical protein